MQSAENVAPSISYSVSVARCPRVVPIFTQNAASIPGVAGHNRQWSATGNDCLLEHFTGSGSDVRISFLPTWRNDDALDNQLAHSVYLARRFLSVSAI